MFGFAEKATNKNLKNYSLIAAKHKKK